MEPAAKKSGVVVRDADSEEEGTPTRLWIMHGAITFGREYCYAIETALVTPVVLKIGLPEQYYSLTWFLSPVFGLLLSPPLGSASDRCTLRWGRRRPFILLLGIGALLGVALFLNCSKIGMFLSGGDDDQGEGGVAAIVVALLGVIIMDFCLDASEGPIRAYLLDVAETSEQDEALSIHSFAGGVGATLGYVVGGIDWRPTALGAALGSQEQVLFLFTSVVFITSLILHLISIPEEPSGAGGGDDRNSLAALAQPNTTDMEPSPKSLLLQSAVLRDSGNSSSVVPLPCLPLMYNDCQVENDDFMSTVLQRSKSDPVLGTAPSPDMHSIDGCSVSGVEPFVEPLTPLPPHIAHDADLALANTSVGSLVDSVLTREPNGDGQCTEQNGSLVVENSVVIGSAGRPPQRSWSQGQHRRRGSRRARRVVAFLLMKSSRSLNDLNELQKRHRMMHHPRKHLTNECSAESESSVSSEGDVEMSVRLLWLSMWKMPPALFRICLCHLCTWIALITMVVFYTDFMGQVVFNGTPTAPHNSTEYEAYDQGVQYGCWGLVIYAGTGAILSLMLQRYVAYRDVSVRFLYCTGTLGFTIGLITMAAFPTLHVCMIGVATMGLLFIVLLYCPYAILGLYHEDKEYIAHSPDGTKRGLGIDCAILSCQAYVSQIIVASTISAIIKAAGTVRVVPFFAAIFALLAFLAAAFLVHYPSMKENEDDDYVQASCGDGDLGNDECDRVGGMDERRNEKTQSGEAMAGAMGSSSAEQLGLGKRLHSIDISMETAV